MVVASGGDRRVDTGEPAGGPRRGDERDLLSGRQAATFTGGPVRTPARFRQEPDRGQAVVEYSGAQREARRAHARGAGGYAESRIDPAGKGQAQAAFATA